MHGCDGWSAFGTLLENPRTKRLLVTFFVLLADELRRGNGRATARQRRGNGEEKARQRPANEHGGEEDQATARQRRGNGETKASQRPAGKILADLRDIWKVFG